MNQTWGGGKSDGGISSGAFFFFVLNHERGIFSGNEVKAPFGRSFNSKLGRLEVARMVPLMAERSWVRFRLPQIFSKHQLFKYL